MTNDVLCPIDPAHPESRIALAEAVRQARMRGGHLHLLAVIPDLGSVMVAEHFPADFEQKAAAGALNHVKRLVDAEVPDEIESTAHVGHGHAAEQILEFANRLDVGLIVLASHHPDRLRTLFVGSVADKIVHNADQSVLVVRR